MRSREEDRQLPQRRVVERRSVALPARLTWKDQRGTTRFASVITRNLSEYGVYVECVSTVSIPLYRLVHFQLEREAPTDQSLPVALKRGRVLSAVYRISAPKPTAPQGLALRLMVDPKRCPVVETSVSAAASDQQSTATARLTGEIAMGHKLRAMS